jgi:UDP-N-acetyl-2-amino-2-deoxyglucuronate dehydrogenase
MTAEPMAAEPLRVAIVGAGTIGLNHAGAVLRHSDLRVAAVADPRLEAAEDLARWVGAETGETPDVFETQSAALDQGDLDLVVICTPSGTHTTLAEDALAAGLHLVVERPLDASLAASRRLTRLANEASTRGQVFSVISQHRFDPASVAVASAMASGKFGRVTSAVATIGWWRGQDYYDSAGWRGTWEQDGGGATMNQGVHTVDLLLWLLGKPVEVFAYTGILAHERIEVEDVSVATIRFSSGALATLHATTAAYPGLAVRLAVHGSRGSAVIHDDQLEYLHIGDGVENQAASVVPASEVRGGVKDPDGLIAGHLRQYQDIVAAVRLGRPPAVGADDALVALALVKSMYVAAHLGRPVPVDDVIAGAFDDVLASIERKGSGT